MNVYICFSLEEISLLECKKPHTNQAQTSETHRPTGGEFQIYVTLTLIQVVNTLIYFLTDAALLEKIKKNKISKCVFLVQKALLSFRKDQTSREAKKLLEVSF